MPRIEVVGRMRTFAAQLGVRCEYCHVAVQGPDGREQVQDYSLDDKDTKKTARSMMRMVADINDKYMPEMGRTLTAFTQVSCETCHHGLSKPRTIQAEMAAAIEAKGADSAVALYRDLRTRYYGRAAYDFGEQALTLLNAISQLPNGRVASVALLRLNLEYYPQSLPTYSALAQQLAQAGDTAGAVDALNKALAIQPDNPQIKGLLSRLKPPKP
jgi:predicted Zn-dependent protease